MALDQVFRDHHAELVRLAGLLTGSTDEANDIVADIFARLLAAQSPFCADHPRAYLRKAVVNEVVGGRRRSARRREIREGLAPPPVSVASQDGRIDEKDRIIAALNQLPPRQRAAIVLRFYEDLTEAQTASELGVALGTVKSSVARGLTSLREALDEQERDSQ